MVNLDIESEFTELAHFEIAVAAQSKHTHTVFSFFKRAESKILGFFYGCLPLPLLMTVASSAWTF
jgi:hypothetical protein